LLEVSEIDQQYWEHQSQQFSLCLLCMFLGGESLGGSSEVPCPPPDVLQGEDSFSLAGLLHPLSQTWAINK
jgi:hypothetical protein